MSFFPIPADKFGTKQKKTPLTKENQQAKRSATRKAHTIKDVRKQRQKTDQMAANRILNLKNIIAKHDIKENEITRLAALATIEEIFFTSWDAKCFIISHKSYLY